MRRKYTAAQIRQLYAERKDRKDPLAGLTLDEVAMLTRLYLGTEWSSYGKLVAYVHIYGKLPPLRRPRRG